ncbi:sodium-dependent transporter [Paremcibacter congregatus]|uniref:Transporter n=1 Tax=Paremcibacter congregatus TaxID=2043170 RepID=A0A2G4YU72_9PROT|nr:sodium-dependent transporter [Paremcibacter congregatus]PHZ85888.1 sodium-dependent transporter [Paremcibacter congregatus]QDE26853.1 sodium-dependent transporter [Paremcibacter congregatus]
MSETQVTHVKWSSRSAFLLASIGAAVGLGNLWRFPYIAGENGGGAFVLIYIGFVLMLGIPLIMSELALGRAGKKSAIGTMAEMVRRGHHPFWKIVGWLSILVPLMGLTYYSIVAGWSLDYIIKAITGSFTDIDGSASGAMFGELTGSWPRLTLWHTIHMIAVIVIISLGVKNGLESAVKIMMPGLFIILAFLSAYAMFTGEASKALSFLFNPDFSKITAHTVLVALGQALFSLAIGVGALITYGAYLPEKISLPKSAGLIALADTIVAVLAGLMIFPIVFQYNLTPGEGPGLIFATLPIAFGQMPGGVIFGTLFFILLAFAAFSSALAMLEPVIAWFEDMGMSRRTTSWGAGIGAWAVGVVILLSFNVLSDFTPIADKNLFGLMDFTVANIMLPVNALMLALFVGWSMSPDTLCEQVGFHRDSREFALLKTSVKYIAPVCISIVVYMMIIGNPVEHLNNLLTLITG